MTVSFKVLFCVSLILFCKAVQSQCILEKIVLNKTDGWKLADAYTAPDSTTNSERWIPANETKDKATWILLIETAEKNEVQHTMPADDFFGWWQNQIVSSAHSSDTALQLTEIKNGRKNNPDIRFAILPARHRSTQATNKKMSLRWFINGKTSFHALSIETATENFTPEFIDTWKTIFLNARLVAPAQTRLIKNIFNFEANGNVLFDSTTLRNIIIAVRARLERVYRRDIDEYNFVTNKNQLRLTLFGNIDTAKAAQLLSHKAAAEDVQFLKADTAVAEIKKQITKLQLASGKDFVLPIDDAGISAGAVATVYAKDTCAARRMLESIKMPVTQAFYFEDNNSVLGYEKDNLYILEKQPLITANEIITCSSQFDDRGYSDIFIQLNAAGKEKLAVFTKNNIGKKMAIVIRGKILTVPVITGEIPDGVLAISGSFSVADALRYLEKIGYPYAVDLKLVSTERKN